MRILGLYLITALLSLLSGCDYMDALTSDDDKVFKTWHLEPFDNVVIETSVKLILKNDTVYNARLEGLAFVVSDLKIRQNGRTIHVEADGKGFRKKQAAEVTLHAPSYKNITSNWPAEIATLDTLKLDNFSMVINGRGAFTNSNMTIKAKNLSIAAYGSNVGTHIFKGEAEVFSATSEGITTIDARELVAGKVNYIQRSVNPGYVFATEYLDVEMAAAGNIYFWGNPEISIDNQPPNYKVDLGKVVEQNN